MKEIKKYTSITRFGKTGTLDAINGAELISITEKIDGANASFILDKTSPIGVSCYSRNTSLTIENGLDGFYDWVKKNITPKCRELNKSYRYFGEWLVQHKVRYKESFYRKFYLFSIWDEENKTYLPEEVVRAEAKRLELDTAPLLYLGKFISIEHIMSFVGKSKMTLEENNGEGVVVKNITYKDRGGNQFFVKFISPQFAEVAKVKEHKVDEELIASHLKVDMVVTKNRIEKTFLKLIDEGNIPKDYSLKDIGIILKSVNQAVYEDVLKEEADELEGVSDKVLSKRIGKIVVPTIRELLVEQGRV